MKIFELRQPKITKPIISAATRFVRDKDKDEDHERKILFKKLAKLGWTFLDKGAYSSVYTNPKKNFVLKINDWVDGGYEHYVEVIKNHPNIHFPNIGDMKIMKIGTLNYYVYLIEKLQTVESVKARNLAVALDRIMDCWGESNRETFETLFYFNCLYSTINYLKKNLSLIEATKIVGQYKGNRYLDMHGGNIMQRQNGTIVITDPYC